MCPMSAGSRCNEQRTRGVMIRVVHAGPSISLGSFKMYVLVYVSLPGIGDVLSRQRQKMPWPDGLDA